MSLLDLFKSRVREVQEASATIHTNLADLREAIAAKGRAVNQARDGSLPLAEVIATFNRWVDETAEHQARQHGRSLVCHNFGAPRGHSSAHAPWAPSTTMEWGFVALFFGDQLKGRFAELARSIEYTPGPPAAERAAVVAQLARELAELESQEEALVDQAAEAGVVIAHRPEVVQRRENERRQRERDEQSATDRRAREAQIDRRHEQRAPEGSQYLRDNRRGW